MWHKMRLVFCFSLEIVAEAIEKACEYDGDTPDTC